jgi:hypothetical protein
MPVLEQAPGLLDALKGEMTPKFLATRDPDGNPNIVPVISLTPAVDQPDVIYFGNFLLRKSIANLQRDQRVGVLVVTPELRGWVLKGDLLEFQRTGPLVDQQMSSSLLRYNAYTGIRDAGLIRITSVTASFAISKLRVPVEYLWARLAALTASRSTPGGVALPLPVRREFARMAAVKVLAWVGPDGYPTVAPILSLQPAGDSALIGRLGVGGAGRPPSGALVAANILTFAAVSYQVKGHWDAGPGSGSMGTIRVTEAYAGGPPIPGGRVA